MAEETDFHVVDSGVAELFSPRGDVGKHMNDVGKRITFLAKRYVGKKTRALELSIDYRVLTGAEAVFVEVTAHDRIALIHHDGTRPHLILPRRGQALRFKDRGRVVYARQVMHPGTRPNPFLVTALREVVGE